MSRPLVKRCKATTAAGAPCRAWPLKDGQGLCLSHNVEARASVSFSGPAAGRLGGRPAIPKPSAIMRQLMADEFMRLHGAHFRTMGFGIHVDEFGHASLYDLPEGGARLHGTSQRDGSVTMSEYDDLDAQRRAANDLLDRHFGRPKQAVAVTGDGGGPILLRIGALLDPVAAGHAAELAARLAIEAANEEEAS